MNDEQFSEVMRRARWHEPFDTARAGHGLETRVLARMKDEGGGKSEAAAFADDLRKWIWRSAAGVAPAVALLVLRVGSSASRSLSRFQDYALPPLIGVPFVTGFLVMHPASNPFSYEAVLLVHVMSANLIFILMPITKLSHAILVPSVQFVSEIGWKWPADSGSRVAAALGKEEAPV